MVKFRSWKESLNIFLYFYNGFYFDSLEKMEKYIKKEGTKEQELFIKDFFERGIFNWQNAEQATGLFDKNGKEIFVGDIVGQKMRTCENGYDIIIHEDFSHVYPIKWDFENTGFHNISRAWAFEKLQIIGNIHENKELLK